MIKINLLNDKLSQAAAKSKGSGSGGQATSGGGTKIIRGFDFKSGSLGGTAGESPAVKLLIVLIFPAILYFYESHNIDSINSKVNATRMKSAALDTKISNIKARSNGAQKKQALIKELDEKIKFIRELSKTRLIEVKALDTLQSIMPEKLWFETIEYSDRVFTISGRSFTQDEYQEFSDAIEKSSFFENTLTEKGRIVDSKSKSFFDFKLKTSMRQEL